MIVRVPLGRAGLLLRKPGNRTTTLLTGSAFRFTELNAHDSAGEQTANSKLTSRFSAAHADSAHNLQVCSVQVQRMPGSLSGTCRAMICFVKILKKNSNSMAPSIFIDPRFIAQLTASSSLTTLVTMPLSCRKVGRQKLQPRQRAGTPCCCAHSGEQQQ
jgi:hypothetical protein